MSLVISIRLNSKAKTNAPVAFASAFVNNIFHVDGIKIWKNDDGHNVQMPGYSNTGKNDKKFYNSHFRYDSQSAQKLLNEEVLTAYEAAIKTEAPEKEAALS